MTNDFAAGMLAGMTLMALFVAVYQIGISQGIKIARRYPTITSAESRVIPYAQGKL